MQKVSEKVLRIRLMLLTVALVIMAPMVAYSYTLTTRVNSIDGQIQVNAYPVQTSGSVMRSIANGTDVNVVITPAAGYAILKVQQGATYLAVTPSGQTVNIPTTNTTSQTINVWFDKTLVPVSASPGPGGTVSPTGTQNLQQGSIANYVFTPATGNKVISIAGTPAGATCNGGACSGPWATNTPVTVAFTVPATAVTMNGVFLSVIANAGPQQTALTGSVVTLDGSASTGAVYYSWSQTAGAPVTLNGSTFAKPTFTPGVADSYQFKLVVNDGAGNSSIAYTTVIVADSVAASARNQCFVCHQPLGIGPTTFSNWSSSKHKDNSVMCYTCHVGANTGGHPGLPLADLYQVCGTCHFDATGSVPSHPVDIGVNTCVTCHNPHSTAATLLPSVQGAHYNNVSTGNYPASYMTSRATCSDCHYSSTANGINRHEWAISGHGATTAPAWAAYDFKTMNGCVRCHTATGFIAFSSGKVTAAWGDAADKTKEVLRCSGCHSDISNGTVRKFTPFSPYADDSYTNPDVGVSNICMACHSGTKNGSSITTRIGTNGAFNNMPFIDPHYMAAGGTMYGVAGYHFPGRTYTEDFAQNHRTINSVDANNTVMGPCITCHKNQHFDHTFRPTWSNNPLCIDCHVTMSDTQLSGSKSSLANALVVLRAQLAAKGFVYSTTYPYFNSTNWGVGVGGANTMGAAFNYILVLRELGAYAHNPGYAKQLVIDSIDYLDNGVIDDSVATIALPGLVASGAITQAVADSLNSYTAKNSCTTCHGGTAASSVPMSSNAHDAHLTSAYGPSTYLGASLAACQTCHVYNDPQHMNRVVDVLNGAGTACANCHSGNVPAWGGTARLACTSCHSANPAVLPNGTAAPYKANFTSSGHGRFTASNQCTACHDPDSSHISGSLGTYVRLRLSNDNSQCGSCHNGATAPAMSSHVLDKSGTSNPSLCKECHDAHGTSNLHMIKTVIKGKTVAFTNISTGFVKKVAPFDGLCQVCHTLTTHFRSGQAPDGHPTKNCLSCHSHTAAFAFMPAEACDSCHGYPPAPAGFAGSHGNYSSARVEDYLGGSGAHTTEGHIKKTARPSEGWANCTGCHANGSLSPTTHTRTLPVTPSKITVNVADQFKFNASLPLGPGQYGGLLVDGGANATGSCSNVKCHFQKTTKWSAVK